MSLVSDLFNSIDENNIIWIEIGELKGFLKLIEEYENNEENEINEIEELRAILVKLLSEDYHIYFKENLNLFEDNLKKNKEITESLELITQRKKIYNNIKGIIPLVIDKLKYIIKINTLNKKILEFEFDEEELNENCSYMKHKVFEYFSKYDKNS